jgi:hypothetical protein
MACTPPAVWQVCAAGALLNILGPDVDEQGPEQRRGLGRLMSAVMAMSAVYDALYTGRPPLVCA